MSPEESFVFCDQSCASSPSTSVPFYSLAEVSCSLNITSKNAFESFSTSYCNSQSRVCICLHRWSTFNKEETPSFRGLPCLNLEDGFMFSFYSCFAFIGTGSCYLLHAIFRERISVVNCGFTVHQIYLITTPSKVNVLNFHATLSRAIIVNKGTRLVVIISLLIGGGGAASRSTSIPEGEHRIYKYKGYV